MFNLNSIFCFYIPSINSAVTENDIRDIFKNKSVGLVNRVDFVPLKKESTTLRSAFLHVQMYDSFIAAEICHQVMVKGIPYPFYPNRADRVYWLLLKNIKPVYETHLNIHQLAENAKLLEERVLAQEKIILNQEKMILNQEKMIQQQQQIVTTQTEQISRIQETIYQITGHVFDQETEMNTIYALNNFMTSANKCDTQWLYSDLENENEENENEENEAADEEKDDVSDFGSMPTLVSVSDDESSEKLSHRRFHRNSKIFYPDDLKERMRFTADFCENV